MRLRACLGLMLLGLTACQGLPSIVRIEIDDTSLQFRKKKPATEVPPSNQLAGDDGAR
ncbi:MAG TPA: hypothetical protein VMS43_13160 [Allosphingosinicella sp.]|nr:hypothetical protein [Allosphingosinicella sp.]